MRAFFAFLFSICLSLSAAAQVPQFTGGCGLANPLPLDAGVSGIIEAHGTCALGKAWLNRPFADVVANGVMTTIYFINGYPDVRKLAQLMGNINPNYGVGGLPLAKWYDQSGNGNDCVQATPANQMSVWLVNGVVKIAADGYFVDYISGSAADRFCKAPSTATDARASSYYFAGELVQGTAMAPVSAVNFGLGMTGVGCCGGGAGAGFSMGGGNSTSPAPANFSSFDWNTFSGPTIPQLWPEDQPAVIGYVMGATNVTITQNEESVVCSGTCPLSAQTETGMTIGGNNASPGVAGQGAYAGYQAFLVFNSALSSGNQTTIRNSLYATFNIPKTQNFSLIIDGASFDISQGSYIGGVNGYGWSQQIIPPIPYPARVVNLADSGATIAQLNTAWSTITSFPCTGSFSSVVYVGPNSAAGNSINGGRTGAQAFSDMSALLVTVKAKCPSITTYLVSTTTGTGGTEFTNYNNAVRAGAIAGGYTVVDLAVAPVMGTAPIAIPLFNTSGISANHPTILGYSYLVPPYLAAIRTAFGQ